jgi:hypothetical protein
LTAYVQVWGFAMAIGRAGGGGYDRTTAAVEQAMAKISQDDSKDAEAIAILERFQAAMAGPGGKRWNQRLEDAGFTVALVID